MYGPRHNPVGPRLSYVAERYPAQVTLAVLWSWAEATGEHEPRAELLRAFVPRTDIREDGKVEPRIVEWWVESLRFQGAPQATRYDRYLPWLAREFNRAYKPVGKLVRRRGRSGGMLPGWDYESLTLGFVFPEGQDDHSRNLIANMVRPTQELGRGFRAIVDWAEATGVDLNRYDSRQALAAAKEWGAQRKLDEMPQGEVVHTWPDGWTVQELSTEEQLEAEGEVMQHCVGGYDPDRIGEDYRIFSLRDPKGLPHATLEYEPDEDYVVELKGKQNSPPRQDYLARLAQWRCVAGLSPAEKKRSVWRQPSYNIPDHADGLRQSLLGLFSVLEGDDLFGEPVLVYADGTVVPTSDYERFHRQKKEEIERAVERHYGSFDQDAFNQGMNDSIDLVEPKEIADDELPAWAEWHLWLAGGPASVSPDSNDQMVEYLGQAGRSIDPVETCGELVANPWPDFSPVKHPTPPGMPLHPTNTILVRLTKQGREEMDYRTLFAWLLYTFNRGYYRRYACGTCQQCIRLQVVKDLPIEGGRKLKHIATFKSGVDPDALRVGDVLLQRVGQADGCGRPYIVVSTDPLETRGMGHRGGRAAGRLPRDFDPVQLERGTLVEMEHTTSRRVAQRIAMDHLVEHPDYYIELAKMEAMLRERRRQGNPWVGMNPGPAPEDWNFYINFVLYAVVGRMREADGLMRQYGPSIRRVAEHLREAQPWTPSKLYRGLLLEPSLVVDKKVRHEKPARTFLSFSEKEDVACWFAHPGSIISSFVAQQRPGVRPYIAKVKGGAKARERMLWNHTWRILRLPGGRHLPLFAAAEAHPDVDAGQFWWNLTTQSEVLLEPTGAAFKVEEVDDDDCPDVDELDATYTYPPFLGHYTGR